MTRVRSQGHRNKKIICGKKSSFPLWSPTVRFGRRLTQCSPEGRRCDADMVTMKATRRVYCHVLQTAVLRSVHCQCSKYCSGRVRKKESTEDLVERYLLGHSEVSTCGISCIYNGTGTVSSMGNWSPFNYHSTNDQYSSIICDWYNRPQKQGTQFTTLLQLVQ
jgi:hypothetical protein